MADEKILLELWKASIDVQKHFNDLELRIRNFAVTLLVAVIGGAGISWREGEFWIAAAILLAGLVGWLAFFAMDYSWYHRFLKAAVSHGEKVEDTLMPMIIGSAGDFGLTHGISKASNLTLRGKEYDSSARMSWFYGLVAFLLLTGVIVSGFLGATETTTTQEPETLRVQLLTDSLYVLPLSAPPAAELTPESDPSTTDQGSR